MDPSENSFVLRHVIQNVDSLKDKDYRDSRYEEYNGIKWRMEFERSGTSFLVTLSCHFLNSEQSISTEFEVRLVAQDGKFLTKNEDYLFEHGLVYWSDPCRFDWETIKKDYVLNGCLNVEVHVCILKMSGLDYSAENLANSAMEQIRERRVEIHEKIGHEDSKKDVTSINSTQIDSRKNREEKAKKIETAEKKNREKMKSFGEEMKRFSDVTLVVKGERFHVLKLFLSSESTYFDKLFSGPFKDSGESEIELKDVEPTHLQYYLEVLYGAAPIDDVILEGVLSVADIYHTPSLVKKCEQFLLEDKSLKSQKRKLRLSAKFQLEELKKCCLKNLQSVDDIRSVAPSNSKELDPDVLFELLQKCLSLQ